MTLRVGARASLVLSAALLVPLLLAAGSGDTPGERKWDEFLAESRGYGPYRTQRTIIRHFFRERRGGTFVDVGAAHHRRGSTTFFLERNFGWSGVAIDALESWAEGYGQHRPHTRFFTYIVTDHTGASEPFYRISGDIGSTTSKERAEAIDRDYEAFSVTEEISVPTTTLTDLLDRTGITKVDFLSMDIEGGEPAALAGFDVARFRPEFVSIEALESSQSAIRSYFEKHGYRRIDAYLEYDPGNWYFTCKVATLCAGSAKAPRR